MRGDARVPGAFAGAQVETWRGGTPQGAAVPAHAPGKRRLFRRGRTGSLPWLRSDKSHACTSGGTQRPEKPPGPTRNQAKSLQSCPTLCDPIDGSPPGSSVPGILYRAAQRALDSASNPSSPLSVALTRLPPLLEPLFLHPTSSPCFTRGLRTGPNPPNDSSNPYGRDLHIGSPWVAPGTHCLA